MKNSGNYLHLALITICFWGCVRQLKDTNKNIDYRKTKSEYEDKFIKHFPDHIEGSRYMTNSSVAHDNKERSFYLYEFDVSNNTLDSLNEAVKSKGVVSYNWADSCLFIFRSNETLDPFDDENLDTSYYDLDCFTSKQPIPNFIHLKSPNSKNGISMDSTFNIYVLESKAGNYSRYKMSPLESMPKNWENGFSRGIAISNKKAVVVYWFIIW